MPSHRANHWGTACEEWAVERRGLVLDRSSWHDARFQNGTPVEIKSTARFHTDDQPGNFKIYKRYHERLQRASGWYCFVVYVPDGDGLEIWGHKMKKSSSVPMMRWNDGGKHRGTKQGKLAISDVF